MKMPIPRILSITAFLLLTLASSAYADYIQGHVLRIDRKLGLVDIVLCESCPEGRICNGDLADHMLKTHGPEPGTVRVVVAWIPRCLREGVMAFARGVYAANDASRFEAVEIFPRRRMGGKDNTGVRSRFRHHRGQGGQQDPHEQ